LVLPVAAVVAPAAVTAEFAENLHNSETGARFAVGRNGIPSYALIPALR
jgi:hypothetical protein